MGTDLRQKSNVKGESSIVRILIERLSVKGKIIGKHNILNQIKLAKSADVLPYR
jgi:hypothetical protein